MHGLSLPSKAKPLKVLPIWAVARAPSGLPPLALAAEPWSALAGPGMPCHPTWQRCGHLYTAVVLTVNLKSILVEWNDGVAGRLYPRLPEAWLGPQGT